MLKRHVIALPLLAAAALLSLAACKSTGMGAAIGSQLGGLVGSTIGSGTGTTLATMGGSVAGGLIGGELEALLDSQSQQQASVAAGTAMTTGQTQTWENPEAGTSGTAEVTVEERETTPVQVPVLKEKVEETPPIDLVGKNYTVSTDANLRGGPGTDYKAVGGLKKGQTVEVIGKVKDKDWYMVGEGGVATGYVSASLLQPATQPQPATPVPAPAGPVETKTVKADRTCRTVKQTVKFGDGKTVEDEVVGCQTTAGWATNDERRSHSGS